MPDCVTTKLPGTTGNALLREQSSGGWDPSRQRNPSFPSLIPPNEPWSFGAPKASRAAGGDQANSWGKESASTAQVD